MRIAGRPVRYLLVAALNAAASNVVLVEADHLGFGAAASTLLSFLLVVPFAYLMHCRMTFAATPGWRNFTAFAAALSASFPVALALVVMLRDGLHLPMPIAAAVATLGMLPCNYAIARITITMRRRRRRATAQG